ncbi:DUF4166 domain-containing protein [Alteromonadaceae bacterium BrNp21-10]|nr:DUF4166 domain-containing protein [Alteromonadaceae bacterium BrNp21-10]
MSDLKEKSGVWFVYDGDCPICTRAAEALHIKQEFGSLSVLNARESNNDPLINEINRRGLDLDEGMVIYANDQFYHGKDALKFMAKYGEANNIFMLASKGLFWSDTLSRFIYPWMRGARNWLLLRRKVGHIDNLSLKKEPMFKSIFGEDWDSLPPVMKKHYANRPYSDEVTTVEGVLDVFCKPPLLWLSPLMKLLGQIPTFNENNVPVTVRFESDLNSKAFHFNRRFNFPNRIPYVFYSRMLQIKDNEVIEIMRFGLGWKMKISWDGEKVVLSHKGYAIQLFGHLIPLPLTMLMGAGNATEYPVDDNTFDMEVSIVHPWWGEMYGYKGRFEVSN